MSKESLGFNKELYFFFYNFSYTNVVDSDAFFTDFVHFWIFFSHGTLDLVDDELTRINMIG